MPHPDLLLRPHTTPPGWPIRRGAETGGSAAESHHFLPPPSDNQFRMSILERLEQMERRVAEMTAAAAAATPTPQPQGERLPGQVGALSAGRVGGWWGPRPPGLCLCPESPTNPCGAEFFGAACGDLFLFCGW